MDRAIKFGSTYFAILGIAAIVFGILDFIVLGTYGAAGVTWGPLNISDEGWGGVFLVWKAIILIGAGAIYISSVGNFGNVRQLAKSVAASIMIWIVAGMAIWGVIAGSIPSGEEGPWFSTPSTFASAWAPPYGPAMYLLPFSLVIIYFMVRRKRATP